MGRRNISTQRMTQRLRAIAVAVAVSTCAPPIVSTGLAAQDGSLQSQVVRWLESSCGISDGPGPARSIASFDVTAVSLFINEFEAGPQPTALRQVRNAASRRFDRIQQLMSEGQRFGLTQSHLTTLQQTQEDLFVNQAVADFTFTYGDAALRAMSILGGDESREFLLRVSQDTDSPHATTATDLLRVIGR